jgi:hypothetical protein
VRSIERANLFTADPGTSPPKKSFLTLAMHFEPMELDDGAVVSWYASAHPTRFSAAICLRPGASEPALLARPAFGR